MNRIKSFDVKNLIYYSALVLLGLFSFSIPCFSNNYPFNYLSIAIAAVFCLIVLLDIFLYEKKIHFGYYIFSLLIFLIVIFVSQLINLRFSTFPKSIFLLSIVSFFIYQFANNHRCQNEMFLSILFGGIVFCFVFIIYYRDAVLHFAFSSRVGDAFNDQNQLGRMMCVYSVIAIINIVVQKNKIMKIISAVSSLLFLFVILLTGSISSLLSLSIIIFISLILIAKKKRTKFISLGILAFLIAMFVGILFLPPMEYFRERIFGIFGSLFGVGNYRDNSATSRFLLFLNAFRMFLMKPIFGNGYFAVSEYNLYGITGHNNFAQLLADTGLFGFLAFEFQFVFSLRFLSFENKKECVGKTLALFLFVFQLFLTTYHQKMDYLIMPIVISLIASECKMSISLVTPKSSSVKAKVTHILNNGISSPLAKMRFIMFLNNLLNLKYHLQFRKKKIKSYKDCFDIELIMSNGKSYADEYYVRNSFYGHSFILKRYSKYKGKVNATIEHGLYFGDVFMDDETINNPLNSIITFSSYRTNKIASRCSFNTYAIGPYIAYASNVLSQEEVLKAKKELGKMLLVIPSHSIKEMNSVYDKDEFVEEIQRIKTIGKFDNVIVCLYYQDILNNGSVVNYYANLGFLVTTCGFRENKHFLDIQRTLFELCDASMSNSVGTHIGYSIFFNKPHYYFNQTINKVAKNDSANKEYFNNSAQKDRNNLGKHFNNYKECITQEQIDACDYIFGFSFVKTNVEIRNLLEKCYISMHGQQLLIKGDRYYEVSI